MKAAKSDSPKETQSAHVAALGALSWSALDAWHQKPKEKAAATPMPLSAEERYRMIELAVQRQASRRRVTPESILWDWLDAEEEVKSRFD